MSGGTQSDKVCSYHEIVEYLNLTTDSSLYKTTRPVLDHTHITVAELDVILMAILSVVGVTESVSRSKNHPLIIHHIVYVCVCVHAPG